LDYGEIPLEDFIHFFNNVMQIQDFRSFLQACNNICIIKKKPKTRDPDIEDSAKLILKAYKRATEKVSEEEKKECEKMLNGYPYSTEQKLAVEIVKPFWLEWMCAEDLAKHDMEHLSGAEQVMLYVKKFFDTVITA
jgi:hypothetical protein